jgi:hypothetical protein
MKAEGETAYEPHILLRMEAIKPRKTNMPATIVAFAEKDRTGILSGRSFANPTFETICGPLLSLLGGTQAQMKSADETATDDAEAIERAEHDLAVASGELMRTFSARIELADNVAALKKIGDVITPQIKARMLPTDLATVRDRYHRRMSAFPANGTAEPPQPKRGNGEPPHDPGTGKIGSAAIGMAIDTDKMFDSHAKALADPTGEEAARQLAAKLSERMERSSVVEQEQPAVSDPTVERILDAGRAAATNGKARYDRWEKHLSGPDFARVTNHIDELRAMAAAAAETKP